ncbi:MAG: hypothetical protein ACLR5S_09585 [Ruminococcus sp.]
MEKIRRNTERNKKQLGDKVNIYSLVAPTAVSLSAGPYSGYTGASRTTSTTLTRTCKTSVGRIAAHWRRIPTRNILSRTDHHCCPGAYYAAALPRHSVNFAVVQLHQDHTFRYLGSMYTLPRAPYGREPEDFTYYTPHTDTTQYDTNFTNEQDGKLLISWTM